MIFPGRKPLLEKLSTRNIVVDDLLYEFSSQNFSGYAEFYFSEAKGIFLLYSGEIITAIYKEGEKIKGQEDGISAIKNRCRLENGLVSTFQLPGEMAHMLRGLCNRQLVEEIHVSGKIQQLMEGLEEARHTGTLDLIFTERKENGMILLINGRVSNTFLEMDKNLTLEGKDAIKRIYELVDEMDGSCRIFKSDFSQEIWKSRRGTRKAHASRIFEILNNRDDADPSPLQELLSKFAEATNTPLFTALLQEDGTLLAEVSSEEQNGVPLDDLHRIIREASPLFASVLKGELKETLCTSQERNLLIRALPPQRYFHVLILDRKNHPKDLRKQLASLDEEIAELPSSMDS